MFNRPHEHISLPNLEIAVIHSIKTVFVLDATGGATDALEQLDQWINKLGYHLHCVQVTSQPGEARE